MHDGAIVVTDVKIRLASGLWMHVDIAISIGWYVHEFVSVETALSVPKTENMTKLVGYRSNLSNLVNR